MIRFARLKFNALALTAMGAGSFVGGTLAAEPLSRMRIPDMAPSVVISSIFILICAYIVLQGFRSR